jgi:hypothetical protein
LFPLFRLFCLFVSFGSFVLFVCLFRLFRSFCLFRLFCLFASFVLLGLLVLVVLLVCVFSLPDHAIQLKRGNNAKLTRTGKMLAMRRKRTSMGPILKLFCSLRADHTALAVASVNAGSWSTLTPLGSSKEHSRSSPRTCAQYWLRRPQEQNAAPGLVLEGPTAQPPALGRVLPGPQPSAHHERQPVPLRWLVMHL